MTERKNNDPGLYALPAVQRQVEGTFDEPYRTILLVQANFRGSPVRRDRLCKAGLSDVDVDGELVTIFRLPLTARGRGYLLAYLKTYMAQPELAETSWLFPLPSNPDKPASAGVCKQKLSRLLNPTPPPHFGPTATGSGDPSNPV